MAVKFRFVPWVIFGTVFQFQVIVGLVMTVCLIKRLARVAPPCLVGPAQRGITEFAGVLAYKTIFN